MSVPGVVATRRFSFTTRAFGAVDDATGAVMGLEDVDTRVWWLVDLVAAAGAEMVSRLWHRATFDVLAAGRDRRDRALPASGHVAAARLGWAPVYPDGVYVPSRVTRVVTAQVMATLVSLAYRDAAIASIAARFDPCTGRLAAPPGPQEYVPAGFARGVVRQLAARGDGTERAARLRITDVQGPPRVAAMARTG